MRCRTQPFANPTGTNITRGYTHYIRDDIRQITCKPIVGQLTAEDVFQSSPLIGIILIIIIQILMSIDDVSDISTGFTELPIRHSHLSQGISPFERRAIPCDR